MKKLFTIIPLVILLCFTFSCQQGEELAKEAVVDVEAEKQAIREMAQKAFEAKRQKDVDAVLNVYAENAIILDEDEPPFEGLEAIRDYYNSWLPDVVDTEGGLKKIVISEAGDMAWALGWNRNLWEESEGRIEVEVKWLAVWEKINGEWKVVALSANKTKTTKVEEK